MGAVPTAAPTRRAAAYWLTEPLGGALMAGLVAALWFLHTGTLTPTD